ncbi:MAG: SIS domain-containing protein [Anaerolineae bacterium]|nr:SIS domain-containing protein [Anaerolineae bacterium]
MAQDFDRNAFIQSLDAATQGRLKAAQLGEELGRKGFKRLYFVGCGAPNRLMAMMEYWAQRIAVNTEIRRYFPAEFVSQNPASLDENTLVILGSHSGTTKETVEAARFLQGKPCTTVGFTQKVESPLAQAVDYALPYGETEAGYYANYIMMQALVSGFLKVAEPGWQVHDALLESLGALSAALAETALLNDARATEEARLYKDDRIMYVVAGGPMSTTAYVLGVCVLMEMQWMHVQPVVAAEFFHGPFEIVDETTPLILLVGEDPSRPEAERVVRFCKKYTERLMIYDSRDFAMPGIAEEIRPIVAPMILEAALSRFPAHLAVWHNHPLSTRRYMWKTEY